MLGAIPYRTFPTISLGPFNVRTFGLMVGVGVIVGAVIAGRYAERFGLEREQTYLLAVVLVVAGVVGSRLTWDVTHWDEIDGPLDLIAVWKGGLQFTGGFIAAIAAGYPWFRRWDRLTRWRMIDAYALGLTAGLALGRVGCTAVGEHFGGRSDFFLAVRYNRTPFPGDLREPLLGEGTANAVPVTEGLTFHQTAIYELLYLLVLFAVLYVVLHRRPAPPAGTGMGVFCAFYAVARGLSDFLRVNDERTLGLTGAQWLAVALVPTAIWILAKVRPANATLDDNPPAELST